MSIPRSPVYGTIAPILHFSFPPHTFAPCAPSIIFLSLFEFLTSLFIAIPWFFVFIAC